MINPILHPFPDEDPKGMEIVGICISNIIADNTGLKVKCVPEDQNPNGNDIWFVICVAEGGRKIYGTQYITKDGENYGWIDLSNEVMAWIRHPRPRSTCIKTPEFPWVLSTHQNPLSTAPSKRQVRNAIDGYMKAIGGSL